jgi:thiamine biosynthesis lipoprotein
MPVRIVLVATTDSTARVAARAAFRRIAELDGQLSDYRSDSELRRIEANAGAWTPVSTSTIAVLARALEIARQSDGAFDPTIGPLVRLWREARKSKQLPARNAIDSARTLVSYQKLSIDSARSMARLARTGMRLDLGGIAKGFILQEALAVLERHGISQALLDAGGDIVVGAAPPGRNGWRIEAPGADSAFATRAQNLTHAAFATSGPSEQFLEIEGVRYSHVVDPRTGLGLTNGFTVYVIATDGATADAAATAFSVLGPARVHALLPNTTASFVRIR